MSIYITGDKHGKFNLFTRKKLNMLPHILTPDDIVIISGDVGLLWCYDGEYEYLVKWLSSLPFTIAFILGNHDNYNMIKDFELVDWCGGKARHIIQDKIVILERGEIYNIQGLKIFTFSGAQSHDIEGGILDRKDENFKLKKKELKRKKLQFRILNESWWKEELPTQEEINKAWQVLENSKLNVDYIITHCSSDYLQQAIGINESNILTQFFNAIEEKVAFKHWYCGHYHMDKEIDNKHTICYNSLIKLEDITHG